MGASITAAGTVSGLHGVPLAGARQRYKNLINAQQRRQFFDYVEERFADSERSNAAILAACSVASFWNASFSA